MAPNLEHWIIILQHFKYCKCRGVLTFSYDKSVFVTLDHKNEYIMLMLHLICSSRSPLSVDTFK